MAPQNLRFFQQSLTNSSYDGLWSKMPLGSLQKPAKGLPRASQEPTKSRPRALKRLSTAFKSLPSGPQEDSKSLLCRPFYILVMLRNHIVAYILEEEGCTG